MHYFKMGYPAVGAFEQNKTLDGYKYVLWDSLDKGDQILIDSKEILNIEHGITILDKLPHGLGFYNFGTNQHSPMILSKYLSHLDDLNEFVFYFKEIAKDLLHRAFKTRFILPMRKGTFPDKKLILYDDSYTQTQSSSHENRLIVDAEEKIYLTNKEYECVEWYLKGKTSSEIAILMGISKRTVETHMEKIKHKLKCSNMFQLGYTIAKIKQQNLGFIPKPFLLDMD